MKNIYNRKKRTRKMRGGGGKSSKSSNFKKKKREAGERMNMAAINQSQEKDTLSEMENRDLTKFMAQQLEEKCEAVDYVNDDGSIDCPTKRSKAKKRMAKFHPDKNPGCIDYANDMMAKYNETCYGDDIKKDIKWNKNDKNYRNPEALASGFYEERESSSNTSEEKQMPSSCKKPTKKMVCRYCQAEGVTDPKCKCCPGSDAAKQAIVKENKSLELMDGSIEPSTRDLITSENKQEFPTVIEKQEDPVAHTCFESQIDPESSNVYYIEKKTDGTYTEKSQWEKPSQDQMCKLNEPNKKKKRNVCIESKDCDDPKKPYCNPVKQKCVKLPKDWMMALNEEGVPYFFGKKQDGTYSEPSWEVPKEPFKNNTSETKQQSLRQKTWDADKTIGSCREMDLHPGTEYWIDPTTGTMSFKPIEGVEKQVVTEETDYFYNAKGETTKDPYDGTCGDISKKSSTDSSTDISSEVKNVEPKKNYIKLFFSTHFNKVNEIDSTFGDETTKVIPWLARR